jgi:hypothetical protein
MVTKMQADRWAREQHTASWNEAKSMNNVPYFTNVSIGCRRTISLVILSLLVLIGSTVIVGFGNYVGIGATS